MADLVQKLRDEECRREAQFMRSPMMNPPMKFTHDEPMRALLGQAATELEALRKRCEAVEADAARLDWLEENCVKVADYYGTGSQLYFGTYATAPLRDAIDQAIAAAQEPPHG